MIHKSSQLAQDFPYLQIPEVGNQVQTAAEKSLTRFVEAARVAFVDNHWVVYDPLHYGNMEKVPMGDSWGAGLCGHFDPDFVCRGFKVEAGAALEQGGDTQRQICYDLRVPSATSPQGDGRSRYFIDSWAAEIIHHVEITRLWLDENRTATTVDAITLFK
jgi:hypothetical protein